MPVRRGLKVYGVDGGLVADTSETMAGTETGGWQTASETLVASAEITSSWNIAATAETDVDGLSIVIPATTGLTLVLFSALTRKITNAGALFVYLTLSDNTKLRTGGGTSLAINEYCEVSPYSILTASGSARTVKVRTAMTTAGGTLVAGAATPDVPQLLAIRI